MNLIEQLGGYVEAKTMRDLNIDSFNGDASNVRIHYMGNCFYHEDLESALLEHRRANNIYEAGDKIVSAFDNINMFGNSAVEISRFRDDINCIDIIEGTYVRLTNGCDCNLDQFRHATDKEIEQGYRDEAK